MGDAEASVRKKFQSLGPGAIPALLELLKDPNPSVRELAGYVVGNMPGLGPQHLPALFRAVESGDGWLPNAIGKIGTPPARDFLLEQLRQNPEQGTQVTAGLENLGASAAPGLAAFFQCGTTCNEELLYAACSVLDEIGAKAASAVPTLKAVAADEKSAAAVRSIAIRCLGRLRRVATDAVPTLLQVESSGDAGLRDKAREAILQVGGDGTLEVIRKMLSTSTEKEKVLIPIGALGERGHELGPSVKPSLSSQDEAERVAAAYALGRIGYAESWPELVAALNNQDDPVLAGSAAESLGRLRVPESRVALEEAAARYWYPTVRLASRLAASALAGSYRYPLPGSRGMDTEFSTLFGAAGSIESCASTTGYPKAGADPQQLDSGRAKSLVYDSEVVGSGEEGRVARAIKVTPEVGIRLSDGWVLGANRGEWGGELVSKQDARPAVKLLDDNIHDIFRFPNGRIVAVAGLAHLSMNTGRIFEMECDGAAHCSARWWKQLPSSPRESWMTASGELLINTYHGGSIVIDQDGRMSMAACHQTPEK
jgi:HEAT repeat protein